MMNESDIYLLFLKLKTKIYIYGFHYNIITYYIKIKYMNILPIHIYCMHRQ